ncbi:MAG: MarC family protein [Thiogranum sp.]
MEHWPEYTRFFTALLVILDPFAALPIFLSLTQGYSHTDRTRAAFIAALAVAAVLVLAALAGESLLRGMGTSRASFRVGGGIVFVLRELMIKMFENKISVEEMLAISALLFVLGALRLGSVFAFQREKQMLEALRSERQSDAG